MADKIRKDEGAEQEQVEKIDLGASLRKEHKDKKPVSRIAILIVLAVLIALGAVLAVVLPRVVKKDDGEQTESRRKAGHVRQRGGESGCRSGGHCHAAFAVEMSGGASTGCASSSGITSTCM